MALISTIRLRYRISWNDLLNFTKNEPLFNLSSGNRPTPFSRLTSFFRGYLQKRRFYFISTYLYYLPTSLSLHEQLWFGWDGALFLAFFSHRSSFLLFRRALNTVSLWCAPSLSSFPPQISHFFFSRHWNYNFKVTDIDSLLMFSCFNKDSLWI